MPRSRATRAGAATARRRPRSDGVRLLVTSRDRLIHARFSELPDLLRPGDLLVINTSRTLPASLPARRAGGAPLTLNLSTPVPFEDRSRWVVELRRGAGRASDG